MQIHEKKICDASSWTNNNYALNVKHNHGMFSSSNKLYMRDQQDKKNA